MGNQTPATPTAATLAGTTLGQIQAYTSNILNSAEAYFKIQTNRLASGGEMSMPSLLSYQAEISKYTLTGQLMATIAKELIDALKSVINKIG